MSRGELTAAAGGPSRNGRGPGTPGPRLRPVRVEIGSRASDGTWPSRPPGGGPPIIARTRKTRSVPPAPEPSRPGRLTGPSELEPQHWRPGGSCRDSPVMMESIVKPRPPVTGPTLQGPAAGAPGGSRSREAAARAAVARLTRTLRTRKRSQGVRGFELETSVPARQAKWPWPPTRKNVQYSRLGTGLPTVCPLEADVRCNNSVPF